VYKLVFIVATVVTVFNNDTKSPWRHVESLTTYNIGTSIVVIICVVYLSLKAIVVCDVLDCSHVTVWFLNRVLAHYSVALTYFLLRVGVPSVYVRDSVSVLVTWVTLQGSLQLCYNRPIVFIEVTYCHSCKNLQRFSAIFGCVTYFSVTRKECVHVGLWVVTPCGLSEPGRWKKYVSTKRSYLFRTTLRYNLEYQHRHLRRENLRSHNKECIYFARIHKLPHVAAELLALVLCICEACGSKSRPEDRLCRRVGGSKHLWNVVKFPPNDMAQHPWRRSSSHSLPWEPEIAMLSPFLFSLIW
jgi:hypothetical protein